MRFRRIVVALALTLAWKPGSASAHPSSSERLHTLTHAIEERPRDASLRLARSFELRGLGRVNEALRDANMAVRLVPSPEAYTERAIVQRGRDRNAAALADLDRALALRPDWADARIERARLRLALTPGDDAARLDARADLDVAIAARPTPELVLERLAIDESRGDLEAAARGLREAVERSGAVVVILEWLRVERARNDLPMAIAAADRLLSLRPDHPGWLLDRAELEAEAGRPDVATLIREEALAQAERQLRLRPSTQRRVWRARALLSLGRVDEAQQAMEGLDGAALAQLGGPTSAGAH